LRVNRKYATVLFGFFMSLGMSFSQSLVISIINLRGFYFEKWLLAFAVGFVVSFPTSLAIIPIVQRIVKKLTRD
jgi:undecaprenyl pyrophosphate phosphatase UppP